MLSVKEGWLAVSEFVGRLAAVVAFVSDEKRCEVKPHRRHIPLDPG